MNFKTHRKQKSFLLAPSDRAQRQRRSVDPNHCSPSSRALLQRAKLLYYAQSDLREAVNLFLQFLQQHPHHDQALYLGGVASLHLDQTQEAIRLLLRISEGYESHANASLLTAMAYNKLGRGEASFETINVCLHKYPGFEEALCFRGRLYLQRGECGRAEEDFKAAVGVRKPSFLSYVGLADCYRAMNRNQLAMELYGKAREAILALGGRQRHAQQFYDIELKAGICLYFLQQYGEGLSRLRQLTLREETKTSELYYYMGLCEMKLGSREKAMLSLQYSMRLQSNAGIVRKAFKRLVLCYLQNYQFYQALNLVKLGEQCGVELPEWRRTVEAFMLVIKNSYEEGAAGLKAVCRSVKEREADKSRFRVKKGSVHELKGLKDPVKLKLLAHPKKLSFFDSPKDNRGVIKSRNAKKQCQFSSRSVQRAIAKIGSVHNYKQVIRPAHELLRYKTEHISSEAAAVSPKSIDSVPDYIFSPKQMQTIYPIILQFKAYAQFFTCSYISCLQTYQQYQGYMKDMFGRESQLVYGRLLCEAMLMSETEMPDDALAKFSECVEWHYQKYGQLPAQPILYKMVLLVRLAAVKQGVESESDEQEVASAQEILGSTLKMMENYRSAIANNSLAHYLQAVIYIMQERLQLARQALEKTLKLTEECTWKYLYVKGVVEMMLGNYYEGVKEFSAGLILQNRAELYLCRAVCFFMLGEEGEGELDEQSLVALMKSVSISAELSGGKAKGERGGWAGRGRGDVFLQNCFDDLQRYIELEQDKLQISIWVSRLLFATRSFQQAMSSLQKIPLHNVEMVRLARCIEIYEGEFEEGGEAGLVIKSAFDGRFLQSKQEERLLEGGVVKNYSSEAFDYLTGEYEKWLVILHLYVRESYVVLLKYIQRELFGVKEERGEVLLRYNLCVVYLLLGEGGKAGNLARSLGKFQKKYGLERIVGKIAGGEYEQDECLQQLGLEIGIGANRLLSNYLPYRPVAVMNNQGQQRRVFVRVSIPFPAFPMPDFSVRIGREFILEHVTSGLVEKKIDAPWVRRIGNRGIQFTEKLDESELELGEEEGEVETGRRLEVLEGKEG